MIQRYRDSVNQRADARIDELTFDEISSLSIETLAGLLQRVGQSGRGSKVDLVRRLNTYKRSLLGRRI